MPVAAAHRGIIRQITGDAGEVRMALGSAKNLRNVRKS
jgi:hypothetical protein